MRIHLLSEAGNCLLQQLQPGPLAALNLQAFSHLHPFDHRRLERRQQALAPEVAKWRRYEQGRREQAALRAEVLGQQAALLGRQAAQLERRVSVPGPWVQYNSCLMACWRAGGRMFSQRGSCLQLCIVTVI